MPTPHRGVTTVTDAALRPCAVGAAAARLSPAPLRFIWPRHTRKHVARAFGIKIDTARDWLRYGVPRDRLLERASVVERGLDELEAEIRRMREEGG